MTHGAIALVLLLDRISSDRVRQALKEGIVEQLRRLFGALAERRIGDKE